MHQFFMRRVGILQRVVKDDRKQHAFIADIAFVGQDMRKRNRMIDIRRCLRVLAALTTMLVRSERDGKDDLIHKQFL